MRRSRRGCTGSRRTPAAARECRCVTMRSRPAIRWPRADTDRNLRQVADVGPRLVEKRQEVADPEIGVVRRVATYLRTKAQVSTHERWHGDPCRRVDVVESLAVDRHRAVGVHDVIRSGVAAPYEVSHAADLGSRCLVGRPWTGTERSRSRSRIRSGRGRPGSRPTSAAPHRRCDGRRGPPRGPSRPATAAADRAHGRRIPLRCRGRQRRWRRMAEACGSSRRVRPIRPRGPVGDRRIVESVGISTIGCAVQRESRLGGETS